MNSSRALVHLASFVNGRAFRPEEKTESGLPVLRIRQLVDPTADFDFYTGPLDERHRVKDGDLIFSWSATLATRIWNRGPAALNQHLFNVHPALGVDKRWLRWAIEASLPSFRGMMHGSAMTHITGEMLRDVQVKCPAFDEQRRIADFLDDQVARLDQSLDAQARQRVLLLERFHSLLAAEILLGGDSDGVGRTRLKYLFEYERNGIWGTDPDGGPNDVPCVRVADFDRANFTAAMAPTIRSVPRPQRASRQLRRGDVLLEKSGGTPDRPVGCAVSYVSDVPAVCSNFVAALRPARGVDPRYAGLLLAAMYQTRRNGPFVTQTTGIQNLDSAAYLAQEVWVPDRDCQKVIAVRMEGESEQTQQLMSFVGARIRLLRERKQALITAAVTGQFDVTTARNVA